MLVVMHSHATPQQIEQVIAVIRGMNLTPHPLPGATRTAIGITGNVGAVDPRLLEVQPGVFELIRVTKPYKLASREMHQDDTYRPVCRKSRGRPRHVHDHRRALLRRERGHDPAHRRVPARARRPPDAGRRLQAAQQPLLLPGHGTGRAGHPGARAREDRRRRRHGADGHGKRRRGGGGGRRDPDRRPQHAELQPPQARCQGGQAGAAEARPVGHAGGMADGGRVRHGRRQLQRDPVRARRAHLLRPQPQHARPVGDPAGQAPVAPADPGGPQPRHRQARLRAADGPGGAGGRRRRLARRDPPRPRPRPVRRGAVAGLRGASRGCWSRCAAWPSRWAAP